MARLLITLAAVLSVLALPAGARAGFSAPLPLPQSSVWPSAVATDSAGDSAVAWVSFRSLPPASMRSYCSLHPFKVACSGVAGVHLAVRSARGRLLTRTVWEGRSGMTGMTLVIGRGDVTLGWGSYDATDPNETAREVHGRLLGRWSPARVLGHFLDYQLTAGGTPIYPRLAVARDGTVLAAWSACGSLRRCPGAVPGVTLAWRAPGHGFGSPATVPEAPEGAAPSFDAGGTAYLHSSCSGRILLAAPRSRRFARTLTVAHGAVRDLSLGLSGAGEGFVSWIPTACSADAASGPLPGPVLARSLRAGALGPLQAVSAGAVAQDSESVAVPGGSVVGWLAGALLSAPVPVNASFGPAPALPAGAAPLAADGGGDVVFGRPRAAFSTLSVAVAPAGGGGLVSSAAQFAAVAAAPFGRGAAIAWQEGRGPIRLSVWRP